MVIGMRSLHDLREKLILPIFRLEPEYSLHVTVVNVSRPVLEGDREVNRDDKEHTQRGTPLSTQDSGPLEDGFWPPGHCSGKCCSKRCWNACWVVYGPPPRSGASCWPATAVRIREQHVKLDGTSSKLSTPQRLSNNRSKQQWRSLVTWRRRLLQEGCVGFLRLLQKVCKHFIQSCSVKNNKSLLNIKHPM